MWTHRAPRNAVIFFETRQIFGTRFHFSSLDGENFFLSADFLCNMSFLRSKAFLVAAERDPFTLLSCVLRRRSLLSSRSQRIICI